jgi:hypothetical protein
MYNFQYSSLRLNTASNRTLQRSKKSIDNKLGILLVEPMSIAKLTKLPNLCTFYVNAGRCVILFDINESDKLIKIYGFYKKKILFDLMRAHSNSIKNQVDEELT